MIQISEEIILKFINNSCSDEELQLVERWINESDENARQIFELEKTAMLTENLKADTQQRERAWNLIHQKIQEDKWSKKRLRNIRIYRWSAAAAMLTGVILCSLFFFQRPDVKMINLVAKNGSMSITLPDSTKVWLNRNASISYPVAFADNSREVSIDGEVYFEVAKDNSRPFTAEGKWINVIVLGTKFNFNSSSHTASTVSLLEGKVEVTPNKNHDGVVLSPGQKVEFNPSNGQMSVVQANTALDAVWHDRLIHFHNASIQEIASDLENLYNVDITIRTGVDTSRTYSGSTIYYGSVDSTLSALCETLPLKYTLQGQNVILNSK